MPLLPVLPDEDLSASFVDDTNHLRMRGDLPAIWRQMANSEDAVRAYLAMEQALTQSTLSLREVEAIKLRVSERNGCEFCLSIHHMKARQAGLSDVERTAARAGADTGDARLNAILTLVEVVSDSAGRISDEDRDAATTAGITMREMVDVLLAITTITFTNFFNGVNATELSLPKAPAL
jgi:AhpD family alkylhydroperoxidase